MTTTNDILSKEKMRIEMIKSDIDTYHGNLKMEFNNVTRKITSMVNDIKNDAAFSHVRNDLESAYKISKATRFKNVERQNNTTFEKLSVAKAAAMVKHIENSIDKAKRYGSSELQEKIKSLTPSVDILKNNGKALESNLHRLHGVEANASSISASVSKPPSI